MVTKGETGFVTREEVEKRSPHPVPVAENLGVDFNWAGIDVYRLEGEEASTCLDNFRVRLFLEECIPGYNGKCFVKEVIRKLALQCGVAAPKVEFLEYIPDLSGVGYREGEYDAELKTIRLSTTPPEPTLKTAIHDFVHHYVDLKIADGGEPTEVEELAIAITEGEVEKLTETIMQHPENVKAVLEGFLEQIHAEEERLRHPLGRNHEPLQDGTRHMRHR